MSISREHRKFATWAGAVKEWNAHQFFKDDLYGIPRKGSHFYDEVFELFYGKPREVAAAPAPVPAPTPAPETAEEKKARMAALVKRLKEEAIQKNEKRMAENPTLEDEVILLNRRIKKNQSPDDVKAAKKRLAVVKKLLKQRKELEEEIDEAGGED